MKELVAAVELYLKQQDIPDKLKENEELEINLKVSAKMLAQMVACNDCGILELMKCGRHDAAEILAKINTNLLDQASEQLDSTITTQE